MVMLFKDFGTCGTIFTKFPVTTVVVVMLLRDFESYMFVFMSMCIFYLDFPRIWWVIYLPLIEFT
jgi:hypothetical protein